MNELELGFSSCFFKYDDCLIKYTGEPVVARCKEAVCPSPSCSESRHPKALPGDWGRSSFGKMTASSSGDWYLFPWPSDEHNTEATGRKWGRNGRGSWGVASKCLPPALAVMAPWPSLGPSHGCLLCPCGSPLMPLSKPSHRRTSNARAGGQSSAPPFFLDPGDYLTVQVRWRRSPQSL